MISYIKVYGPPVLKAIKALEKIAVEEPRVCIMDSIISMSMSAVADDIGSDTIDTTDYFGNLVPYTINEKRCNNIISKSGKKLGEYDFFFEWFKDPTVQEMNSLIEKLDAALTPLGCKYTITTKE